MGVPVVERLLARGRQSGLYAVVEPEYNGEARHGNFSLLLAGVASLPL